MAQSFWQNLFIFKGAIPAKAIAAAKDFGYDEKKMRSRSCAVVHIAKREVIVKRGM